MPAKFYHWDASKWKATVRQEYTRFDRDGVTISVASASSLLESLAHENETLWQYLKEYLRLFQQLTQVQQRALLFRLLKDWPGTFVRVADPVEHYSNHPKHGPRIIAVTEPDFESLIFEPQLRWMRRQTMASLEHEENQKETTAGTATAAMIEVCEVENLPLPTDNPDTPAENDTTTVLQDTVTIAIPVSQEENFDNGRLAQQNHPVPVPPKRSVTAESPNATPRKARMRLSSSLPECKLKSRRCLARAEAKSLDLIRESEMFLERPDARLYSTAKEILEEFCFSIENFDNDVKPMAEQAEKICFKSTQSFGKVREEAGDQKGKVCYNPIHGETLEASFSGSYHSRLNKMNRQDRETFSGGCSQMEASIKEALQILVDRGFADRQAFEASVRCMYALLWSRACTRPQKPHFDFSYQLLRRYHSQLFLFFCPLTASGCQLQIWSIEEIPTASHELRQGIVVTIPFGRFLLLPGATMHGGGFVVNPQNGDPRLHAYVVLGHANLHRGDFSNVHYMLHADGAKSSLSDQFAHHPTALARG